MTTVDSLDPDDLERRMVEFLLKTGRDFPPHLRHLAPATNQAPDPAGEERSTLLEQLQARMLSSDDIDQLPAPQPLIDGVLWADTIAELWGKPGSAKSFLAIDWALSIATGRPWQGKPTTQGPVLYIVGEGAAGIGKRRRAWSQAWRTPDTSALTWLRGAVPLMEPGWVGALAQAVQQSRPALIVIDTLSRSISGHNENAAETMSAIVTAADYIRAAAGGACVLFVHHATKTGDTTRGHSALEGACDVRWKIEKTDSGLLLTNPKSKDEAEASALDLRLHPVNLGQHDTHGNPVTSCIIESHRKIASADELTASEARLLATMRDTFETTGATPNQIREVVPDITKPTFYRALNTLAKRGAITNSGSSKRQHWHLTPTLEPTP